MNPEPLPTTITSRIRALLGLEKLPRYRVIDRSTRKSLEATNGHFARYRIVESLIEQGWTWETLDVVDADGKGEMHGSRPRFGSLAIARTVPNAIVVADIPGNGSLFTCPVRLVACSEAQLDRMADELQAVCHGWEPEYHSPMLSFVPGDIGEEWGVPGGFVLDRLWVADEVERFGWSVAVSEFVSGARETLPQPLDGQPIQILGMVPDRITDQARERLRLIVEASTLEECQARREELATWLRRRGQDVAAEALVERDH